MSDPLHLHEPVMTNEMTYVQTAKRWKCASCGVLMSEREEQPMSRVVRLRPQVMEKLKEIAQPGETLNDTLVRVLGIPKKEVVPHDSREGAR